MNQIFSASPAIANPLYDAVFKYLLKDIEIAGEINDSNAPLVQKIVGRLSKAIESDEIREQMWMEFEVKRIIERAVRKVAEEKDEIIAEKDRLIAEKDKEIEIKKQRRELERNKALSEKDEALATLREKKETLLRQIEDLKKLNK